MLSWLKEHIFSFRWWIKIDLQKLAGVVRSKLPSYARPMFVRLVPELSITGTYKLKKIEMQLEGYSVENAYYFETKAKKYEPLTRDVLKKIENNQIRFWMLFICLEEQWLRYVSRFVFSSLAHSQIVIRSFNILDEFTLLLLIRFFSYFMN